jgi:hypothetical protein
MHPAAGVLVYVISALATHHPSSKSSPAFFIPLIMCVLLAVQIGAIKVARSKSGMAGQLARCGRRRCTSSPIPPGAVVMAADLGHTLAIGGAHADRRA